MKRALLTGAGGFAGRHLTALLLAETAWNITGVDRRDCPYPPPEHGQFIVADLTAPDAARQVVAETRPDYVFHLAAATPPTPDDELMRVNVTGAAVLLEALGAIHPDARVLMVGSDAEYGPQDDEHLPTNERAPLQPLGAYGRSKVLQERMAREYTRMCGLKIVCVRPFNYIGPGQAEHFVVPALARQIALAERGLGPLLIEMGRTDTSRDFTDVRDMVRAFLLTLLYGRPGYVYNIGSGSSLRIETIARLLAEQAEVPISFHSMLAPQRRGEVMVTRCDASRVRRRTGWAPRIPIEQTIADTLNDWRTRIGAQGTGQPGAAEARQ